MRKLVLRLRGPYLRKKLNVVHTHVGKYAINVPVSTTNKLSSKVEAFEGI